MTISLRLIIVDVAAVDGFLPLNLNSSATTARPGGPELFK